MKNEQTKQLVQAAVFFDGTGNNRTNSIRDPATFGNITNISNLMDACAITDHLYIEGVGTLDNKADSTWAKATGSNRPFETGFNYEEKLQKGIDFMNDYADAHPNDDIELFVYGFSRGATLARDFAKQALTISNVRIKFLGIYDTVMALVFLRPRIHFTGDEMNRIDQILHLTAINETRKYFPLTSLLVKNGLSELVDFGNTNTAKVKEIFVPGAHSDLGGGYLVGSEYLYLNKIKKSVTALTNDLNKAKKTVKDHFANDQQALIWDALLGDNISFEGSQSNANWVTKRDNLTIELIYVYFEIMASYTNTFSNTTVFTFTPTNFPAPLAKLKSDVLNYIQTNQPDKGPNYNYADLANYSHISVNFGKIKGGLEVNQLLNTFDPELLRVEIERAGVEHSDLDLSLMNEAVLVEALGFDIVDVNSPNNGEWHRSVIYG